MSYIKKTEVQFDAIRLQGDVTQITNQCSDVLQINLRKSSKHSDAVGVLYGAGSLYDQTGQRFYDTDASWDTYNGLWAGMYVIEACRIVEKVINERGMKLGRARIMVLPPKSCLTYHVDPGNTCRYHVPVMTSDGAWFINNGVAGQMDTPGALYTFDNTVHHTAINASREKRIHIVLNAYQPVV